MKSTVTICLVLFAVTALTGFAAGQTYDTADNGIRTVTISPSKAAVPKTAAPANPDRASLTTLFSNLSDYKYATYYCCSGVAISGPKAKFGFGTFWFALPLTPKANVALSQIEAPFFTIAGTASIAVWLAADASGVPGDTIAGPIDVDLPAGFGCCALSTAKFANVPLTKKTKYWIVVGTDSNSADSNDSWNFNTTDMRAHPFAVYGSNGTWTASGGLLPAIGIFGK